MSSSQPAEGMEPVAELKDVISESGVAANSVWLRYGNLMAVFSISAFLVLAFFKPIFRAASISRLCVLAEWDSVFDFMRTGKAQAYDPSLVQIFGPDYVFLAQKLSKGILPLWNPHSGLGYPFIADIQSSAFAPLRFIFDFAPSLYTYNMYLILELLACGLATFFLARVLGASRPASVLAALVYTFCPYNLWYMEMNLGASSCLFPLTALAFAYAAERATLGAAILAGVASGVSILSGHPECSFFGIALSSLLMLLLLLAKSESKAKAFVSFIKLLLVAGLTTIAISAPALFPFAEYLLNGESYKYGPSYSTPVSCNGIFFNLFNPGQNGASPYLGIIAVALCPLVGFALSKESINRHKDFALVLLTVFSLALVSQVGPLVILFSKPPLTAIITRYALPFLLLLIGCLAARGLDVLSSILCTDMKKRWVLLVLCVVPIVGLVFVDLVSHNSSFMKAADFDAMLPTTALNTSALRRDAICAALFASAALLLACLGKKVPFSFKRWLPSLFCVFAIGLSFTSEASVAKLSLPLQSKFFYPQTELIDKLKDPAARVISTCEYVFRPATNSVYGVNFLTVHNPLFPKRFLQFLRACGAKTDTFNQSFDTRLSRLLDLASVKYILSLKPVEDAAGDLKRFREFYKSKNNIWIFENQNAAPRAFLVENASFCKNADAALQLIQAKSFDPSKNVVIEEAGGAAESDARGSDSTEPGAKGGSVESDAKGEDVNSGARDHKGADESEESTRGTIKSGAADAKGAADNASSTCLPPVYQKVRSFEDAGDSLSISVNTKSPCWLVVTDIYYPGWSVYVDGQKNEIRRANFAFRAVRLASGDHKVSFRYEPFSFTLGLVLFAVAVLLAAASVRLNWWKYKL